MVCRNTEQLPDFPVFLGHYDAWKTQVVMETFSPPSWGQSSCIYFDLILSRALCSLFFISLVNFSVLFIQDNTSYPLAATYSLTVVLWLMRTFPLKADVKRERWPNHKMKTIEHAIFNLPLLCLEWTCRLERREVISWRRRRWTSNIHRVVSFVLI